MEKNKHQNLTRQDSGALLENLDHSIPRAVPLLIPHNGCAMLPNLAHTIYPSLTNPNMVYILFSPQITTTPEVHIGLTTW